MTRSSAVKSTIVRSRVLALRAGFRLAEAITPAAGGRYATRMWLTVPDPPRVTAAASVGDPFEVTVGGTMIRGTEFGSGPAVYLVHGWGGVAGQLSAFIDPLVRAGYRVVAFDGPSHGRSDPGAGGPRRTHGVEFAAALSAVTQRFGPADTVIAHSMGALPALIVRAQGLQVERFVFLAPMRDIGTHLHRFASLVGMGPRTRVAMNDRIAAVTGHLVADLDVRRFVADPVPLLVVHDRDDRETSAAHSAGFVAAWAGPATMISTVGLGHRRLLSDPSVVRQVVDFMGPAADRPAKPDVVAATA